MSITSIAGYFSDYGLIAVFVIVFLEYLNLPGFPAGIIMPLAGIMAASSRKGFLLTILVSTLAGVLGSILLYFLGRFGGEAFARLVHKRFPKQESKVKECEEWLRGKGYVGVFVAKLIPAVRTLVSIPAGAIRLNFYKYVLWSTLGVVIWNTVFVGMGYFMGEGALSLLRGV